MESRSEIEHDFLGMQSLSASQPRLDRRESFRGISKMNPEIVRKVMDWASKPDNKALDSNQHFPISREDGGETAPFTIFYKGTVTVFDLPQDKAQSVIKFVADKSSSIHHHPQIHHPSFNVQLHNILDTPNDGDLPIKRKKSLQRFFEKRKERLISVSPCHVDHVSQLHHKSFA